MSLRGCSSYSRKSCTWPVLGASGIAWQTIYGHFRRWAKTGLWDQAMQPMKWRAGKELGMIDSTYIKVHRDGANPAGGQEPQALLLTAGTEADVVHAPALLESVQTRQVLMDKADDSDALRELTPRPRHAKLHPATQQPRRTSGLRPEALQEKAPGGELLREEETNAPHCHAL